MRRIFTSLFVLLVASVFAVSAHARTPSGAIENSLAELGFRIGPEVTTIVGGDIEKRTWVSKRYIIVPDSDSRSFLVRFRESCAGTATKRMIPRIVKIRGNVSQYDTFVTRYETRDLAKCEIRWVYELEPI